MKMKTLIYSGFCMMTIYSFAQDSFASDRIYGSKMLEYVNIPEDVIVYKNPSKNSEQLQVFNAPWERVVSSKKIGADGTIWYDLSLIDGAYAGKLYKHHDDEIYISGENVIIEPDVALKGLYEGRYLGAYCFEYDGGVKNRIVLFSETKEGDTGKTLHAYGFDNVGIETDGSLDTKNVELAFHQGNFVEACSGDLLKGYLDKTFMADTDSNGIDEIWYTFPHNCENPYYPKEFHVIMQENDMSFHAKKRRIADGPADDSSLFEPIESNLQNPGSNETASSVLTWLIGDVMTDKMYADKVRSTLLGKWAIVEAHVDFAWELPQNEQVELEFLADGTMHYNNPQYEFLPQGKHSYKWFFKDGREVFIQIAENMYKIEVSATEGLFFASEQTTYYTFRKES